MNKVFLLISALTFISFAQSPIEKTSPILKEQLTASEDNSKLLIWVFFTDKGNNLNKMYSAPENVVSPLSLKRRAKTLDNSSLIDFTDLQVNDDYIKGIQSHGFELKQKSKWFNAVSGYITKKDYNNILTIPYVKNTDIVNKFRKNPEIDNPAFKLDKKYPASKQSTGDSLNYGLSLTQNQQINIPALHNLGYSGQGVTVCMMDAGVSLLSHEAFAQMHILATYDFVNHRT